MNGYYSKQPRFWRGLSLAIGLTGVLLWPSAVSAEDATRDLTQQGRSAKQRSQKQKNAELESRPARRTETRQEQPLSWARIDFILNRVNLVPRRSNARRARISDVLGIGDALQTFESSNAELRFNDGSEVRIGSQATFRFTPNTRNFELTNGTVLLLIPPERGRTTIQTPNAVTGIQGSALFVRYIEETDTTIVGALTDNPDGPMILYTNNGSEEQALYANQVGVVKGDRITELYEIDSRVFWESSGLAETFDYSEDVGTVDELDGVRQEIREAIDNQEPIDGSNVVENPENFSRPESAAPNEVAAPEPESSFEEDPADAAVESEAEAEGAGNENSPEDASVEETSVEEPDLTIGVEEAEETEESTIQYEGSPAEEFHNQDDTPAAPETGGTNSLQPAALTEAESEEETEEAVAENSDRPNENASQPEAETSSPTANENSRPISDRPVTRPAVTERPANNPPPANITAEESLIDDPVLLVVPDNEKTEIIVPTAGAGQSSTSESIAQPNAPTGGVNPLPSGALQDADPSVPPANEDEMEENGSVLVDPPATVDALEDVEAIDPPTISEDEPGEVAPIIEETDATLNNPSEAEAVEVPENPESEPVIEVEAPAAEAVEADIPDVPESEPVVEVEAPAAEAVEADVPDVPESEPVVEVEAPAAEAVEADIPDVPESEPVIEVEAPAAEAVEVAPEVSVEEAVEIAPPEAPATELIETDSPEVFEDELILPEDPAPVESQVPDSPDSALEEVPLIEVIEEPVPAQLEESVPFPVEQFDDSSPAQEIIDGGNEQIDSGQIDDAGGSRDDATLSNTPSPELR